MTLTGGGLCRQMEVTTVGDMMEAGAILIGVGCIAGVILGIVVVAAG